MKSRDSYIISNAPVGEIRRAGGYGAYIKKIKSEARIQSIKVGRNDKCPCLSGKKFKKCCINK